MKIKYVVIKEKGIVKALPVQETAYVQGIDPVIADMLIKKYGVKKSDLTLPKNLIGIARLYEGDSFNEDLGKEIAKERLLKGYYKCVHSILCSYYKGIEEMAKYAKYKTAKAQKETKNAEARLNKLTK